MPPPQPKSLMRSLGEAFGILWHSATKDVSSNIERTTIKHEVEETHHDSPQGRVTVRRTTIEEIDFDPDGTDSAPQSSSAP